MLKIRAVPPTFYHDYMWFRQTMNKNYLPEAYIRLTKEGSYHYQILLSRFGLEALCRAHFLWNLIKIRAVPPTFYHDYMMFRQNMNKNYRPEVYIRLTKEGPYHY